MGRGNGERVKKRGRVNGEKRGRVRKGVGLRVRKGERDKDGKRGKG